MTGDTILRYDVDIKTERRHHTMTDAERERKRQKTVMLSVRLQKSTDADILKYLDGKQKQTVIKAALREYMERHPDPKPEYRYGMRLRGYSPGAQPKGVLRREDDTAGKYHDIIVYDRMLSADEIRDYELEELK